MSISGRLIGLFNDKSGLPIGTSNKPFVAGVYTGGANVGWLVFLRKMM